jgi:hypothetical protein
MLAQRSFADWLYETMFSRAESTLSLPSPM